MVIVMMTVMIMMMAVMMMILIMILIESGNLLIRLERSVKQEGTQTLGHSDTQS